MTEEQLRALVAKYLSPEYMLAVTLYVAIREIAVDSFTGRTELDPEDEVLLSHQLRYAEDQGQFDLVMELKVEGPPASS